MKMPGRAALLLLLPLWGCSDGGLEDIGADTGAASMMDASKPDIGSGIDAAIAPDAEPEDMGSVEDMDSVLDTGVGDAEAEDLGGDSDMGSADQGVLDSGPSDLGPGDAGPGDLGHIDIGATDTGPADVGSADIGAMDIGPPDLGPKDLGGNDGGASDLGPSDSGGGADAGACTIAGAYDTRTLRGWLNFDAAGNWAGGPTRADAIAAPPAGSYTFTGTRLNITNIPASPCMNIVGVYDVIFGAGCSFTLSLVMDTCSVRANVFDGLSLYP
ncbi:MAG: hypothetical protein AAFZ18_21850 [Myxococcota bacterium]